MKQKYIGCFCKLRLKWVILAMIAIFCEMGSSAQINLKNGNVLNLVTSDNPLYFETMIKFNTGAYRSDNYCWSKISDSIDNKWLVTACFNGDCKNDLLQSGCFIRDFGFNDTTCYMAFHVETFGYEGKSVIRYNVHNKLDLADQTDLEFNIRYIQASGFEVKLNPENISIYPDPVSELMTIKSGFGMQNATVEIANCLGEVISRKMLTESDINTIDLSDLSNGIYVLKIESGDQIVIKKFMKQ